MAKKSHNITSFDVGFNADFGHKKDVKLKKIIGSMALFVAIPLVSSSAFADDFGCQALLCFAGGKNVSECQPTIKKVIRDMSKGKPFPHCQMVGSSSFGSSNDSNAPKETKDMITVKHYTQRQNKRICQDGVTVGTRTFVGYSCKTIEINVKPEYAADKSHVQQFYNY